MRVWFVSVLFVSLVLGSAAATVTPSPCYDVWATQPGDDTLYFGYLSDVRANGKAYYSLVSFDQTEWAHGNFSVVEHDWVLLTHAVGHHVRSDVWTTDAGQRLSFTYTTHDGEPGGAAGGGMADGWLFTAHSRC